MFEFFKKPRAVSEPITAPNPDKAAQFVAAAKAPQLPKKAEMVYGRPVHSVTPVMSNQEAEQFTKTKPVAGGNGYIQASPELLTSVPRPEAEILKNVTRAGYLAVNERVETAPPFSDSQGQSQEQPKKQGAERPEMTVEEMLAARESLLQEIGGLKTRQMALDDALDAASIQELSRVNSEVKGKEALLADLEEALANGADSEQPGQ